MVNDYDTIVVGLQGCWLPCVELDALDVFTNLTAEIIMLTRKLGLIIASTILPVTARLALRAGNTLPIYFHELSYILCTFQAYISSFFFRNHQ